MFNDRSSFILVNIKVISDILESIQYGLQLVDYELRGSQEEGNNKYENIGKELFDQSPVSVAHIFPDYVTYN